MIAPTQIVQNINQGNWQVGGTIDYATSGDANHTVSWNFTPTGEYFFLDRFSLGVMSNLNYSSAGAASFTAYLGPSASYYYLSINRFASFVNATFEPGLTTQSMLSLLTGRVVFEYFATPSVAFGPAIVFTNVTQVNGSSYGQWTFSGAFRIYL